MPSHIDQLPVPLMLQMSSSASTISSFVPGSAAHEKVHKTNTIRQRRTLSQLLGGDILVRLFGYRHARWALHYFLGYLLCSSITMLACVRLFCARPNNIGRDCCSCHRRMQSKKNTHHPMGDLRGTNLRQATLSGFYYRTRLGEFINPPTQIIIGFKLPRRLLTP